MTTNAPPSACGLVSDLTRKLSQMLGSTGTIRRDALLASDASLVPQASDHESGAYVARHGGATKERRPNARVHARASAPHNDKRERSVRADASSNRVSSRAKTKSGARTRTVSLVSAPRNKASAAPATRPRR